MPLQTGLAATVEHRVGDEDTAQALGSGDVAVLGTPRVVALLEAACVQAVAASLAEGETTVGTRVEVEHLAPSVPGAMVQARAELTAVAGGSLRFAVSLHGDGEVLARGDVARAVVQRHRFLTRLGVSPA